MKIFFLNITLFFNSALILAFPWNSSKCEKIDKWCKKNNTGFSSFDYWKGIPSSGFGSPYHKHTHVPIEHILSRPHILKALLNLENKIDEVLNVIINSKNKFDAVKNMQSEFGITKLQAEGIIDIPIENLTENGLLSLYNEYKTYVD